MPSRARSGHENAPSSGSIGGHAMDHRRASKQYQTSRFANEKPVSPRAGQTLKFKEKVKLENPIRPPHADLPLKFVKNDGSGFMVQTDFPRDEHQSLIRKSVTEEEELVKYMSKLPGYLLRGEKPRDNVLNFGVLDWKRLENWTHKQSKGSLCESSDNRLGNGDCSTATNGPSVISSVFDIDALTYQREQSSHRRINSFHVVDPSPVVKPLNKKDVNNPHVATSLNCSTNENQQIQRKPKPRIRDGHGLKSAKGKAKHSDQGSSFATETLSSEKCSLNYNVIHSSKKKISSPNVEPEICTDKFKELRLDSPVQHCSGKQDSIVLLLPKDFSRPGSSEIPPWASLDGRSAEFSWGSFSDIFSVDEIQSDESLSDVQHSCPLTDTFETESELDLKLDTLVKAQGVKLPMSPPSMPLYSNKNDVKEKTSGSTTSSGSNDLDESVPSSLAETTLDTSVPRRFSFSEMRLGRSLSYREGSAQSQLKSTYVSAKSGPANPVSSTGETPTSSKANSSCRTRNSPFKRLLDPLLKRRALNKMKEHPNNFLLTPTTAMEIPSHEECEPSTTKAFLHLTLTGGLPLFKFMVETKNEILASTVKSLSTFGKEDCRWLYTFYSVQKIKKKSVGGWKNNKPKPSGFSYNIVGQMKVSNPKLPSWCDESDEQYMVKESVLFSIDLGKGNAATSELMLSRELAAIVVKMPKETIKTSENDILSGVGEEEIAGNTVVILPSGIHTVPHEGVPSSLINRWRSGGLCDCGGWDVGCKLRILTNPTQERKTIINARLSPMQGRCDLFEKGEPKERGPFLSLVPFQEGLFSVEYDAEMSALQAFSICVAIINSQMPTDSLEQEFNAAKPAMIVRGEGAEKHAPHPPLSPVGRV